MGWGGRCGGIQDRGTQVYLWLVHVHVWSKPPEYCKVVSLQLNKLLKKKKKKSSKNIEKNLAKERVCHLPAVYLHPLPGLLESSFYIHNGKWESVPLYSGLSWGFLPYQAAREQRAHAF